MGWHRHWNLNQLESSIVESSWRAHQRWHHRRWHLPVSSCSFPCAPAHMLVVHDANLSDALLVKGLLGHSCRVHAGLPALLPQSLAMQNAQCAASLTNLLMHTASAKHSSRAVQGSVTCDVGALCRLCAAAAMHVQHCSRTWWRTQAAHACARRRLQDPGAAQHAEAIFRGARRVCKQRRKCTVSCCRLRR